MATPIPDNRVSLTLAQVAAKASGRLIQGSGELQVRSVVTDSRRVQGGELYVALSGEVHDGHAFIARAAQAGAAAALVADAAAVPPGLPAVHVPDTLRALGDLAAAHRAQWGGRLVAITGSAGKTTTKELTAAALAATGCRVRATVGNLNNLVGAPMTLFTLDEDADTAVIEIGTSAPGEIGRLSEIVQPDLGVVTSVSVAHTEGLGSLEAVADEKTALLRALGAGATAIYHGDSQPLRTRVAGLAARCLSFGGGPQADVRLLGCDVGPDLHSRCSYALSGVAGELEVRLPLLGRGPALDAGAALAVVWALKGEDALASAVRGLEQVAPVPGRLAPLVGQHGGIVLDDTYNANPASTRASLQALAQAAAARGGRALACLGDMKELGQASQSEHEAVGQQCLELGLAQAFFCGPQMRFAAEVARTGGLPVEHREQVGPVLESLRAALQANDVVLIKGSRSMAMEQLVQALAQERPR